MPVCEAEGCDTRKADAPKKARMPNPIYAWDQMLSLHLNDKAVEDAAKNTADLKEQEYYQLFRWLVNCFLSYADRAGEDLRALRLVVMTRRCAALVEICMQLAQKCLKNLEKDNNKKNENAVPLFLKGVDLERLLKIDAECCITDAAAIASVPEWFEQYRHKGAFPLMVVLDDLMLHGRACNSFLRQIENKLTMLCTQQGFWRDRAALLQSFVRSVYIDVYARSERSLLLYTNYYDHFRAERKYSLAQCRRLSYKIAMAVASSTVSNISSEWGLIGDTVEPLSLAKCPARFFLWRTDLQDKRDDDKRDDIENNQKIDHFLFFYPDCTRPTAIGSLRLKYSAATGQPMLMPCFILADIPFDRYRYAAERLYMDLKDTACGEFLQNHAGCSMQKNTLYFPHQIASAVNLLLSKLLYEEFFAQISINKELFHPNECQLARAFRAGRQQFERMYQQDLSKDAGVLLQVALRALLADAEPFWEVEGDVPDLCSAEEAYRSVLDAVADLGLASEKHAHQLYMQKSIYTSEELADMERQLPVRKIFQTMQCQCEGRYPGKSIDPIQMTAYLIHMVDYGMAGFKWGISNDDTGLIRTEISAGEPSLFLKPRIYADYLRILAELQDKCSANHTPIQWETDRLVARIGIRDERERERLSLELAGFLEDLNQSGQSVSDWLFPVPFSVIPFGPMGDESLTRKSVEDIQKHNMEFYQKQTRTQINRVLAYYLGA